VIRKITINNFKCFKKAEISFSELTVLCGLNGMGKSSVIQAILMLRQSWGNEMLQRNEVMLNGELIHLGQGKDVLYEGADEDVLRIEIEESAVTDVRMTYVSELDLLKIDSENKSINNESLIFSDRFQYLRAERIGPRISNSKEDFPVIMQRNIGEGGEFASFFMIVFGEDKIYSDVLLHEQAVSSTLKSNVEAWMSEVSPGIQINYEDYGKIDQTSMSFSFITDRGTTNNYRATNVGFGISYTLPVIVSLLSAKPGSLIIIENPEAHLHPRGQRKIGELIAKVSSIGAQVIIETHSDHVLNGIRLSAKKGRIKPGQTTFNYFDRQLIDGQIGTTILTPVINEDGRFSEWPDGFFDEWDNALDELLQ